MTPLEHYDEIHGVYLRNVNRMMEGRLFTDEGDETTGYAFRVAHVRRGWMGIDSLGMFCAFSVIDTEGAEWAFYSSGIVCDAADVTVGSHSLALGPDPAPVVCRTPPVPLVEVAAALAREEWSV